MTERKISMGPPPETPPGVVYLNAELIDDFATLSRNR